jgi:Uma2 family endonuclease
MSTVADVSPPTAEVTMPPAPADWLWRLSVEQYHEMARKGILMDGDPVELLEGLLVRKMTILPPHRRSTHRVQTALRQAAPPGYYVASPSPVTLAASEPEPDVVVVRGSDDDYPDRHPGPSDVALVVEVSDTSLKRDQGFKKSIYARAGIPVYWIVNLVDRRVEVYTEPTGPGEKGDYRHRHDFGESDQVALVIEGREVARIGSRELLP